ncbi:hypothetical protein QLQ84_05435 [Halomonas sp. LN1S58]|uniref:ABC transporter permease n=1 Tax=Halomonas kalidii TaxID=3043293 RepID=A0ABT6VJR5_9GAMM|nr:hypothetical protein [Halomonas kalidii]MDI5933228.1 hypothetical protein [Halomonas kalidii]
MHLPTFLLPGTHRPLLGIAPLLVVFLLFQRQFVQSFQRAGIR